MRASFDALYENLYLPAARESDGPRLVIGNAEFQQSRLPVFDHFLCSVNNGALNTAA